MQACLTAVEAAGAQLMVGFNRRFDPHFRAVRSAIDDGAVGAVEMVKITSRDPGAAADRLYPALRGGIFRDMTIHDFDMARWLLGEEPATVFATASVLVDPEVGRPATSTAPSLAGDGERPAVPDLELATRHLWLRPAHRGAGLEGMIAAENQRPVSIEVADCAGFSRPPLHDFFMTRYTAAYAAEIAAFVAAVAAGSSTVAGRPRRIGRARPCRRRRTGRCGRAAP